MSAASPYRPTSTLNWRVAHGTQNKTRIPPANMSQSTMISFQTCGSKAPGGAFDRSLENPGILAAYSEALARPQSMMRIRGASAPGWHANDSANSSGYSNTSENSLGAKRAENIPPRHPPSAIQR